MRCIALSALILLSGCTPLPPVELQSVDHAGTAPLSHSQAQMPVKPADSSTLIIDAEAVPAGTVENSKPITDKPHSSAGSPVVEGAEPITPNCRPNCGQSTGLQIRPTVPLDVMQQALPPELRREPGKP